MAILIEILIKKATHCVRLFLFLTLLSCQVHAQTSFQSNESIAFNYFLNLQFGSCKIQLKQLKSNPYALYMESLLETSKIFLSDDIDLYHEKKELESIFLDSIEKTEFSEAQKVFLQSEIKIQWAVLKLKFGDEFAAFWSLKRAYHLTQKNIEDYPDFIFSEKSMGLMQVIFGIVPDNYNWILSILGIEGDVQKGLEYLKDISDNKNPYSLESELITSLLQTYLLNEEEDGFKTITKIRSSNQGLLLDYSYGLIAIKNSKSELALEVLNGSFNNSEQLNKLPQMYYLLGEIHLQKSDPEKATAYYRQFIKHQSGLSLVKDAYYKIGICYLINDNLILANESFEKALSNGWTKNEADKYAQLQIESNEFSNKELYKLRYATDGGFYENATKIQSGINQEDFDGRDLCEYYYRSARLFQKTGDLNAAIEFYLKTIETQEDESWYYAPNAALQLGLIFESGNDLQQAKKYLELVFNYKNHPYQKSIRQKAKTALKSLD